MDTEWSIKLLLQLWHLLHSKELTTKRYLKGRSFDLPFFVILLKRVQVAWIAVPPWPKASAGRKDSLGAGGH
jgi:hypothetical protein